MPDKSLSMLLHESIKADDIPEVNRLLDLGADINELVNGDAPLYCSISFSRPSYEMTLLLIERGADVNQFNSHNENPLSSAAWRSKFDTTKALLENGAYPNLPTWNNTQTALHCAIFGNADPKILILLIKYGANPFKKNAEGKTPLECIYGPNCRAEINYHAKIHLDILTKAMNASLQSYCFWAIESHQATGKLPAIECNLLPSNIKEKAEQYNIKFTK